MDQRVLSCFVSIPTALASVTAKYDSVWATPLKRQQRKPDMNPNSLAALREASARKRGNPTVTTPSSPEQLQAAVDAAGKRVGELVTRMMQETGSNLQHTKRLVGKNLINQVVRMKAGVPPRLSTLVELATAMGYRVRIDIER